MLRLAALVFINFESFIMCFLLLNSSATIDSLFVFIGLPAVPRRLGSFLPQRWTFGEICCLPDLRSDFWLPFADPRSSSRSPFCSYCFDDRPAPCLGDTLSEVYYLALTILSDESSIPLCFAFNVFRLAFSRLDSSTNFKNLSISSYSVSENFSGGLLPYAKAL